MGFRYQQPDNEDAFEQMCLRYYRKFLINESLQLYGKRGLEQDGVDIFDPIETVPIYAVQCKHHEPNKTIPPAEIKGEVAKAEKSHFKIERYIIATTAKKHTNAQKTVADLNKRPNKKFTVEVHFWEEVCQYLSTLPQIQAHFIVSGRDTGSEVLASILQDPQIAEIASRLLSVAPAEPATGAYSEIERLLIDRNFEAAKHELKKLPVNEKLAEMACDDRYKILRLRAKLDLEIGEFESAGELFLHAFEISPELDQAKQNRVLGLSLLRRADEAYKFAKQYVAGGLTTSVMVLRLIDGIPSKEELAEYQSIIDSHVEANEDINNALAHKRMIFGDYTGAYEAAERALQLKPESPHAHLAAALSIHSAAVHGGLATRTERLQQALVHYDTAESAARDQTYTNLVPEILVNRAAAHMLLGDLVQAGRDYRDAITAASKPSVYVERAIGFFLQEQQFDSAWELLDSLDRTTLEAQYLALVAEFNSSATTEKRAFINDMQALGEQDWDRAAECIMQCVQWSIILEDCELAGSFVTAEFQEKHPFQAHILLAWIHLESGRDEQAREEADKALNEDVDSAHPQELRLLARLFVRLKQDEKAVGLLEQVAHPGVLDGEMMALIMCAQRLRRDDLLLRVCSELRASGAQDENVRKLEIQLLNKYAPQKALALVDQFIKSSDKPSYFVAFKNLLAVRLNHLEKLNVNPSELPGPAELSPADAYLVILPYETLGKVDDALRFLYTQRRLNFENEHAHGSYIFFFLRYAQNSELRTPASKVEKETAVLLEINGREHRWVIIEKEQPAASRNEFASSSAIGKVLLGSEIGDVVELPGISFHPELATVREIQTKYVRAFQDSLHNFTQRFPGSSMLQQVRVGDEENFDPTAIIESLKGRKEHVDKCVEVYRDHPCSLYLFADNIGLNELEAIKSLASIPNGVVKCCQTSPQEFEQLARAGLPNDAAVLSISTIITLTLLDGWEHLDSSKRYMVAQSTSELVGKWIHDAKADQTQEGGGVIRLDDANQLVLHETTEEQRQAELEEIRRMRDMIDQHCEVESSAAVADLDPEKRDKYRKLVGLHNVESMSLAKDNDAVLWTDDVVVGYIGTTDFGVPSKWTQLVLRCQVEAGSVSIENFNLVTAKLASWHYGSIIWNPATIIAAGIEAAWNTDAWPLSQCIALIEKSNLPTPAKVGIVVEFLTRLRRSECIEMKQSAVIHAVLNALGSPGAVRWIHGRVDHIFGIDIPSADYVRLTLEYWLSKH